MTKLLIIGSGGQLGQNLKKVNLSFDAVFLSREDLDVTDANAVNSVFQQIQPNIVINASAYTNVDAAEDHPEACKSVNVIGAKNIAEACTNIDACMIHFSTDYVFDGSLNRPYLPEDPTIPINTYGQSKLEGEKAIFECLKQTWIFRISWLYSNFGHNFKSTVLKLVNEHKQLKMVGNQYGCPTYAGKLAEDLNNIAKAIDQKRVEPGVYHYSHDGVTSWYGFAREIMKLEELDVELTEVLDAEFPTKAKRPNYSKLDGRRTISEFQLEPIHWKEALMRCKRDEEK